MRTFVIAMLVFHIARAISNIVAITRDTPESPVPRHVIYFLRGLICISIAFWAAWIL